MNKKAVLRSVPEIIMHTSVGVRAPIFSFKYEIAAKGVVFANGLKQFMPFLYQKGRTFII